MQPRLCLALVFIATAGQPGLSQEGAPACETQQELEQVLQSNGEFMPDGCRQLTVTPVARGSCFDRLSGLSQARLERRRSCSG